MGLMDWVTLGRVDQHGASAGEFHLTLGTSWEATLLGATYDHVLGSTVSLTCDPIEMLMAPIYAGGTSVLGGIALGVGGSNEVVYGSQTHCLYGGPHFEIQRARNIEKHSDWFLRPKFRAGSVPAPDPLEPTTTASVLALSVLINAVPAAMEIALYAHYKEYYSAAADEPIQKTPELLKFMAYGITSRLIAIQRALETSTAETQIGAKLVAELAEVVRNIGSGLAAAWQYVRPAKKEASLAEIMSDDVVDEINQALAAIRAERGE